MNIGLRLFQRRALQQLVLSVNGQKIKWWILSCSDYMQSVPFCIYNAVSLLNAISSVYCSVVPIFPFNWVSVILAISVYSHPNTLSRYQLTKLAQKKNKINPSINYTNPGKTHRGWETRYYETFRYRIIETNSAILLLMNTMGVLSMTSVRIGLCIRKTPLYGHPP